MSELKLADLGEGMHEAEVVEWLIHEGDTVKLDQTVVKVETDKAIVEIPSPVTGRVSKILVPNGQTAKVGDVLVVFDAPAASSNGDSTAPPRGASTTATTASTAAPSSSAAPATQQATAPARRVLAAPAVRKRAFELGINIEQVTPSNPNGRVSLDDVETFARQSKSAPSSTPVGTRFIASELPASEPPGSASAAEEAPAPVPVQAQEEREPLTGLRKRIAEHMERSEGTRLNSSHYSRSRMPSSA